MERLIRNGQVRIKNAKQIGPSRLGIGFEKLDRKVFEPENAYDLVGEMGVHYVRLQSGWQRTETQKGVYDFAWLDDIVDNLIARGQEPWIDFCYGNELYTPSAREYFGAVGCPPIFTEEERNAWDAYVEATVRHFHGRVRWYEVWNEPDGRWCWKHGVSAEEYGDFAVATANAIHRADGEAKAIAGVLCNINLPYFKIMFDRGVAQAADAVSFHRYNSDELNALQEIRALRALIDRYNPKLMIIQGESGTQSDSRGAGALRGGSWTETKQAKYTLRHRLLDLSSEVVFTSHFSALDMIEALNGKVGDKASYLDYGYFGLLHADFDENGIACGTYSPKPSYRAMQHLAALFPENVRPCDLPVTRKSFDSPRVFGQDDASSQIVMLGFDNGRGAQALAYWKAVDLMRETFEGTISFLLAGEARKIGLIDLMTGEKYDIPEHMQEHDFYNSTGYEATVVLKNLPLIDSPLLLTFGDFETEA
ncbi:MAG: beta-galactosidase [Clostridia bacterium]|nr:beta-galactosidase [Clostridia bacterium]